MDYKKSNAPTNTVTRDMIALSEDTGNVYETVCIIGKRANQIAVEMKADLEKNYKNLLLIMIIWKRFSKTGNKLRFPNIMKSCQNPH